MTNGVRVASVPRQGLDRPQVIAAARDLVNRDGLEALTMRALSRELGVEAPSLYTHVTDKCDILDGLAELVYSGVSVAASDEPWPTRVQLYCGAFRGALLRNPNLVPVVSVRPVMSTATHELMDAALGELVALGLSSRQALFTLDTIVAYVIGHVLTELSGDPALGGHEPEEVAAARAALPEEAYPHVRRTLSEGVVDRTAEFEHGMKMIIAGIADLISSD